MDEDGDKLSKRLGSLSLGQMRDSGIEPMAIACLLAKLGTSLPVEPFLTMEELAASFDLSIFSRTSEATHGLVKKNCGPLTISSTT